jgi:hypothetical protein
MNEKTLAEIEILIQVDPDELSEEELESYLKFAEIQEKLDEENCIAVLAWG